MVERPILFQTSMVRALRAGTKTQTRRAVKGLALEWLQPGMFTPEYVRLPENCMCPYGKPGDRLYVREAFSYLEGQGLADRGEIWYWADGRIPTHGDWTKPKPSIHMPRWACRILLEVTAVRVERLQDISEADAHAEGCSFECMTPTGQDSGSAIHGPGGYIALWESINGSGSWEANPWVWVVEFKRVTP